MTDIEYWTQDDVRGARLDNILARHNLTAEECGVPGGIGEWQARAEDTDPSVSKPAQAALSGVIHIILNLMRAETNLPYTDEPDPGNWSATDLTQVIAERKRKLVNVAASAQSQWRQQKVWRDLPSKLSGWGNDKLVNTNPLNYDGVRNTTDANPGWWYRMVFDDANRETVLSTLVFFNPGECLPEVRERLLDPEQNPRRKRALDIAEKARSKSFEAPKRRGKKALA